MTTTDPKLIERAKDVWCEARRAWRSVDPAEQVASGFTLGNHDAAAAVIAAAINEAVQNERAGIVAWLRASAFGDADKDQLADELADAIERGAHLPSPPAIEAKESQHGA